MLSPDLLAQLANHVELLHHDVVLATALDDSAASQELAGMLDQIAELSPRITVERRDHLDRRPAFSVIRDQPAAAGEPVVSVDFAGIPGGHEFNSLVLAILQVGGHPPRIDDAVVEAIRSLDGDVQFETWVSLTCQNCPDVVQALNAMSVLNPRIHHTMVDGSLFPEEVEAKEILAVPAVFVNGVPFAQGRMGVEEILAKLDSGNEAERAAALDGLDPYEVLIVGGGPAAFTAATYAARKGIRTGIVCDRIGGQLLDTLAIENYPSVAHTEGPRLAADLDAQARSLGVEVHAAQQASALVPAGGPDDLIGVPLRSGATLQARTVIVATGARWRRLNVPGEEANLNKGVAFCPHCDGPLFAGKDIAVNGGGNSGVEAAIDLAGVASHVTLIEFADELLADAVLCDALAARPNTTVICNAETTEILGEGRVSGLRYTDRTDGASHEVDLAGVFVQIGLVPNTEWLGDLLERTGRGEIVVDERGLTSVPGVFAAGDCTTEPFKQIVVAAGAGATAALSAFDHLVRSSVPA